MHYRMNRILLCLLSMMTMPAFAEVPADFKAMPKIDVHVHINSDNNALLELSKEINMRLLTINVDYPDFPPLAEQLRIASEKHRKNPQSLAFAGSFLMQDWQSSSWQANTEKAIDTAIEQGAVAIKVWKNIGMGVRSAKGSLLMIDDPVFDPIFAHIKAKGVPLIGHQGEPYNCWLPVSEMSVNNDKDYFSKHPQYHMYLHPGLPSYQDQMQARNRMLDKNPDLKFMGAHMASLEWSVDELAKFLDQYPNAVVDMAARMGQIQSQTQKNSAKVKAFFVKYQDRILYATDFTQEAKASTATIRHEALKTWLSDWKFLSTNKIFTVEVLSSPVKGLALPKPILEKIYHQNAERFFHDAWALNNHPK